MLSIRDATWIRPVSYRFAVQTIRRPSHVSDRRGTAGHEYVSLQSTTYAPPFALAHRNLHYTTAQLSTTQQVWRSVQQLRSPRWPPAASHSLTTNTMSMSTFFKRAQRSLAKAVQKSGVEGIVDELPYCEPLCYVQVLSIKLDSDEQRNAAIMEHVLNQEFTPINFLIRDERNAKRTVMTAELVCSQGFRVQQQNTGQQVMEVTLSNHSSDSLGKILHPSGATVYKVHQHGTNMYRVQKATAVGVTHSSCVLLIEKVLVSLYPVAKWMGILGTSCVYWFKDINGNILGYVRPKLVMRKNTLIVKFMAERGSAQERGAMVGAALLFVLHEAYPELSRLLRDSMHDS